MTFNRLTDSRALLFVDRLREMEKRVRHPMLIIETGSLHTDSEDGKIGEGWSTLHIARFLHDSPWGHRFVSIDTDISTCDRVLQREGLRWLVELLEGDSRQVIPNIRGLVDAVYLDSGDGSDPRLMLEEALLLIPKAAPGALFCCDDVIYPEKSGPLLAWLSEQSIVRERVDDLMMFWPKGVEP